MKTSEDGALVEVITETVRHKYHAAQVLAGPVCAKHNLIQLQIAVWHEEYGWIMLRMLHVLCRCQSNTDLSSSQREVPFYR